MFTPLENIFFLNRSRTTQEGSQGLWDYPQPTPDASRGPKQQLATATSNGNPEDGPLKYEGGGQRGTGRRPQPATGILRAHS